MGSGCRRPLGRFLRSQISCAAVPLHELMLKTLKRSPSGLVNLKTKRKLTLSPIKHKVSSPSISGLEIPICLPRGRLSSPTSPPQCPKLNCRQQCLVGPCHQNDTLMSNSHLHEQTFPVLERKRMPVVLLAQHPSLLHQPTVLPFSFEGTTPAPFSVQVGKRLRASKNNVNPSGIVIGSETGYQGLLSQSGTMGISPWTSDGMTGKETLCPLGLPSGQKGGLEVLGAIFATPRKVTQNKANEEKIRAKKWRQIHDLYIFTPQPQTLQFSYMHKSREKSITNNQDIYPALFFFLFFFWWGRESLEYFKGFSRHHVISPTHILILKPALNQVSVICNQRFLSKECFLCPDLPE